MLKVVLIAAAVLVPLLAVGGLAYSMMYLVKSANKKRTTPKFLDKSSLVSKQGVCARCGEVRVLVKEVDSLCAFCYSSLNTKKVD